MSELMSQAALDESLRRQIAYNWGWLRLAYAFIESLETLALKPPFANSKLNVTGDPATIFLVRIENQVNGSITSARWENSGLAVSRPSLSNQFHDTEFDGQNLEFRAATPEDIAIAVLNLACEAPIASQSS
jgi:hypothetical protein